MHRTHAAMPKHTVRKHTPLVYPSPVCTACAHAHSVPPLPQQGCQRTRTRTHTACGSCDEAVRHGSSTLQRYTAAVHCSSTLQRYTAAIHCSGTMQRYTAAAHCSGTLQQLHVSAQECACLYAHAPQFHPAASIPTPILPLHPARQHARTCTCPGYLGSPAPPAPSMGRAARLVMPAAPAPGGVPSGLRGT